MSWHEDFSEADYQQYWQQTPAERDALIAAPETPAHLRALLLYQQGQWAIAQNDVNAAIAHFEAAIALQPGWHQCWTGHATAMLQGGETATAIASCDRALQLEPEDAIAWSVRGAALYRQKRYEAAADSCDRALATDPDNFRAWSTLSDALHALDRYTEAIVSYDRALALQPDHSPLWRNRGMALQRLGRHQEAISSYDKHLRTDLKNYQLWYQRGLALRQLGRFDSAIANFDLALNIRPDFYPATRSKLFLLLRTGQLLRHFRTRKTWIQKQRFSSDLKNVVDSIVKTKMPALVVIALMVLSTTHSRPIALITAGLFLLITVASDLMTEARR